MPFLPPGARIGPRGPGSGGCKRHQPPNWTPKIVNVKRVSGDSGSLKIRRFGPPLEAPPTECRKGTVPGLGKKTGTRPHRWERVRFLFVSVVVMSANSAVSRGLMGMGDRSKTLLQMVWATPDSGDEFVPKTGLA